LYHRKYFKLVNNNIIIVIRLGVRQLTEGEKLRNVDFMFSLLHLRKSNKNINIMEVYRPTNLTAVRDADECRNKYQITEEAAHGRRPIEEDLVSTRCLSVRASRGFLECEHCSTMNDEWVSIYT
jgi:hypothetical protein